MTIEEEDFDVDAFLEAYTSEGGAEAVETREEAFEEEPEPLVAEEEDDFDVDAFLSAYTSGPPIEEEERTFVEHGKSALNTLGLGASSFIALAGEPYALITGDRNNVVSNIGALGKEYFRTHKSPVLVRKEEARQAKIDAVDARYLEGIQGAVKPSDVFGKDSLNPFKQLGSPTLEKIAVTWWETISNPELLLHSIVEQAPMYAAIGGIGKGAQLTAKAFNLTKEMAAKIGTGAAVSAGVTLAAGDSSSQAFEMLMDPVITEEMWRANSRYMALIEDGVDPHVAKSTIANALAGDAFIRAALVSGATMMIPGSRMFERYAGGKRAPGSSRWINAVLGFFGEASQEYTEESSGKFFANLAASAINLDQDLMEGVAQQGAQASIVGGAYGALAGGASTPTAVLEDKGPPPLQLDWKGYRRKEGDAPQPNQPLLLEFDNGGTLRIGKDGIARFETAEERAEAIVGIQEQQAQAASDFEMGLKEIENAVMGTNGESGLGVTVPTTVDEALDAGGNILNVETEEVSVAAHEEYMRQKQAEDDSSMGVGVQPTALGLELERALKAQAEEREAQAEQEVLVAETIEKEGEVDEAYEEAGVTIDSERGRIAAEAEMQRAIADSAGERDAQITEELRRYTQLEPGETLAVGERRIAREKLGAYTVAQLRTYAKNSGIGAQGNKADLIDRLVTANESINVMREYGSLEAFENGIETGAVSQETLDRFEAAGLGTPKEIYERGQGRAFDLPENSPDPLAKIDLKGVKISRGLGENGKELWVDADSMVRRTDKKIDNMRKFAACLARP